MDSRVTVVYHRADMDGLFSGAVCWHWLTKHGIDVRLVGWDFGDPLASIGIGRTGYIVDLPPDCVCDRERLGFWIDHHKSSIEKFPGIPGLQIDGVAACRLAWHWFEQELYEDYPERLPTVADDFIARRVDEPMALTLAGEYDVWDKHDPRTDEFQFGLQCETWTPDALALEFFAADDRLIERYCEDGRVIMKWQKVFASQVCQSRGYYVELGRNRYWALASVHARNSSWFPNEGVPEDANGLLCYRIEGDGQVKVSLYNREGRENIDHSVIAVKYGGGGHKGACGFSLPLGQAVAMGIVK